MNPKILKFLEELLPEHGKFIEVGGYDGESHSMTVNLADKGWSGVYFEPIIEFAERCRERHKDNDVKVIVDAVGDGINVTLKLAGELTSSKEYVQEVLRKFPTFNKDIVDGERTMKTVQLNKAIDYVPDFLVIDVEGMEWEVLQYAPEAKVIVIELHKNSEIWMYEEALESVQKCEKWFKEKNYECVYFDDINSLFVKQ